MFCADKNSYLQLVTSVQPRILNRAVALAMSKIPFDPHDCEPPATRMTSMVPSHFAPHVDITRRRLGFLNIGLRKVNQELHSPDPLIQLQAVHSIVDLSRISEKAMYLISLHTIFRLIDLMLYEDPTMREKVCMALMHFASYYQGRVQMLKKPILVENLMHLIVTDINREIRYAAAFALNKLVVDRCTVEKVLRVTAIVENLLKMVRTDHVGIVLLHLDTLVHIFEWDQIVPLENNAFELMFALFAHDDNRIVSAAMRCMVQILKNPIAKHLADENDIVFNIISLLKTNHIDVVKGIVSVMEYATLTTRSKWRVKEICPDICKILVGTAGLHNYPAIQLIALRTLINLNDMPDVRYYLRNNMENKIKDIYIRTDEKWDGTDTTSYRLETALNCRSLVIENTEVIRNDYGDNAYCVNVHSYLGTVRKAKEQLLKAIHLKPHRFDIVFK